MLEIINQDTNTEHGNDCLIENCYMILKCHDIYIVQNIRRYRGWCDNGLDIRGYKEFDNAQDAYTYYNVGLRCI